MMTIQNVFDMNNVIAIHEPTLNFNIHNRAGNNKSKNNKKVKPVADSVEDHHYDHDEIREYDVEQAHRNLRISGLSPSASKRRKMITKLIKIGDG